MNLLKTTHQRPLLLGIAALLASLSINIAFAEIAVITNTSTATDSLTVKQVRAIFLKKKTKFPDGSSAVPGDQSEGNDIKDEFGKKVLRKKPNQLGVYWSKRVFSGKGVPPEKVGNDAAMMKWVAATPGSLGYVDASVADPSVKILLKIQ